MAVWRKVIILYIKNLPYTKMANNTLFFKAQNKLSELKQKKEIWESKSKWQRKERAL